MNIIDIDLTNKCKIFAGSKNFYIIQKDNLNIEIRLDNVYLPFGSEKYNDKLIVNFELEDNNNNNNIISKLLSLENNIKDGNIIFENVNKNIILSKGLSPIVKKSKLGHIIRTHLLKNTEIYIPKKNGEKMMIDNSNLQYAYCDAIIDLKGIWLTENSFGFYLTIKSIRINKFGD
jgi:hypothetical protein